MRISTQLFFDRGLSAIQNTQASLAEAQLKVATGKKILAPSDDPAAAKRILDLNGAIAKTEQFGRNAETATGRLSLADSVLDGAGNIVQRVRELAITGDTATLSDADRMAIASELRERLDELLGLANTRDANNEYLFSGFATSTRPFAHDGAGTFTYAGNQGQRRLQIGPSYQVPVSDSGTSVFQAIPNGNGTFTTLDNPANTGSGVINTGSVTNPAAWVADTYTVSFPTQTTFEVRDSGGVLVTGGAYTVDAPIAFNGIQTSISGQPAAGDSFTISPSVNQDLFSSVHNLITAFEANTANGAEQARLDNAVNRTLTDLDQGMENLLKVRARVGARINAVDNEVAANEQFTEYLNRTLSAAQDIDLAAAVTELNLQLASLQAAQQSFARVQNLSLFNSL